MESISSDSESDSTGSEDLKARRVNKHVSTASKKKRVSPDTSQKKSVSAAEAMHTLGIVRVVKPSSTRPPKKRAAGNLPTSGGRVGVTKPASTDREALKEEHDSGSENDEDDSDDSDEEPDEEEESFESGDSGDDPENPDVITEDFLRRNPLSR